MQELRSRNLTLEISDLAADGRPILGICLGMQLLSEKSYEHGENSGLGLLNGSVSRLSHYSNNQKLRLPHVSFSSLSQVSDKANWLLEGLSQNSRFYFIHSYALSEPGSLLGRITTK